MQNILIIFLVLLLGVSCSNDVTYKSLSKTRAMITSDLHIKNVEVIDWKVGPMGKQIISKGLRFKVQLPILDNDDLKDLITNTQTTAWLLKLSRRGSTQYGDIGRVHIPLTGSEKKKQRGIFTSSTQQKDAFFEVMYSAAAPSKRFESFKCPAFGHNYSIEDIKLVSTRSQIDKIVPSASNRAALDGKSQEFSFMPAQFNGGPELASTYTIEIAAYDHINKVRRSDYIPYPEEVQVSKEIHQSIKGCSSFDIPSIDAGGEKRKFKMGR